MQSSSNFVSDQFLDFLFGGGGGEKVVRPTRVVIE